MLLGAPGRIRTCDARFRKGRRAGGAPVVRTSIGVLTWGNVDRWLPTFYTFWSPGVVRMWSRMSGHTSPPPKAVVLAAPDRWPTRGVAREQSLWRYECAGEIHDDDGGGVALRLFLRACSSASRSSLTLPSVIRWQRRRRLRLGPCAETWRPFSSACRMKARRCRIPLTSQKRRFESCRWTCLLPARLNPARACASWWWFERSSSPLTAIQTAYVVAVMRMLRGADWWSIPSSSITRRPSLIGSLPGSSPCLLREMTPDDLWRRSNRPGELTWLSCRSRAQVARTLRRISSGVRIRRSSLKGRGRSRVMTGSFFLPSTRCLGAPKQATGSRFGRSPTAQRPPGP